ncbi:MAG: SUMF1/EgtB/PvdO family nonheme iron enzyme [Gemmataceae bacterium]
MPRLPTLLAAAFFAAATARAADPAAAELAAKARQILDVNCHRCHGQDGTVEGGLNFILDAKKLVARKTVLPGEPGKSKLYKRLTNEDDPMPPEAETVRPSKEDIALVRKWIAAGAPAVENATPARPFIADAQVMTWIHDDLAKADEGDRRFLRYFTVAHLYNAGLSDDELQTYRAGLSKLVNSLSWGRRVVVPTPIDPAKTLLRVDLRELKWGTTVWTRILSDYPYGTILDGPAAKEVYTMTDWELPAVRADWFVYAASRPPLYHDILRLPQTDRALEKELKVDVMEDIEAGHVVRAGFNGSGVSRHNRLIERHESPYGTYWKSYDFGSSAGRQNLFGYPFGPGTGPRDFQHDGGEIIFTLPNGLQGYMLVDGRGNRIDEGPTKIVSDPRQQDRAVVNGISCMSCHARGILAKADQVREHVVKNPAGFTAAEASALKKLYLPADKMSELYKEDAERFRAAVAKTGVKMSQTEPVAALALRFEAEMDLPLAAAELGLPVAEFSQRLGQSAKMARALGALNVGGGTVQRRTFEAEFSEAVRELKLGRVRTVVNSVGMRLNFVPAGEFLMGVADDDTESRSNERPRHKVRITKPMYVGVTHVTQEQYMRVNGKNPAWFTAARGGGPDHPVEQVSWDDAVAFCKALSDMDDEKQAGRRYRLPTEAEWEYFCRAGTTTRFPFGDEIGPDQANHNRRWNRTTKVGSFPANRFGLFDPVGNVWQLCSDWYEPFYYAKSPVDDPQGPKVSPDGVRIMRGGCFGDPPFWMRSAGRSGTGQDGRSPIIGFRVVWALE